MRRKSIRKMWLTVYVTVFCLFNFGCTSGKPSGGITVPNGGFESGIIVPWTPFQAVQVSVSSDHMHGGKFSLAESAAAGSAYVDLKGLKPGTTYTVSAWVSSSPGATATAQIAVFDPERNVATFSDAIKPTEAWQQLKYAFKGSASGLDRIHLFRNAGDGTVYWDDVQIVEAK